MKFADDAPPTVARGRRRPRPRDRPGRAHRRRGADHPGRPRRPGDRHGPAPERGRSSTSSSYRSTRTGSSTRSIPSCGRSRPSWTASSSPAPARDAKNSSESVASGLAAVTQSAVILKKGFAELDPLVAIVHADACTDCGTVPRCVSLRLRSRWARPESDRRVAVISETGCKGCGGCVPGLSRERHRPARLHRRPDHGDDRQAPGGPGRMNAPNRELREVIREEPIMRARIVELLDAEPRTVPELAARSDCPTHEVLFWIMGMRRYGRLREVKGVTDDGYFRYEAIAKDPIMTTLVDTDLLTDLQRYGARTSPPASAAAPARRPVRWSATMRRSRGAMIRYAQVGMRDQLLSSKELWTCYACGECSETCPTQAEPSEFMAAARRYAIANYDRTGLARTMYTRPDRRDAHRGRAGGALRPVHVRGSWRAERRESLDIFGFIPEESYPRHRASLVMVVVFAAGLLGVATMARAVSRGDGVTLRSVVGQRAALRRSAGPSGCALAVETLGQRRYRRDCDEEAAAKPWYLRRWFLHAATMWGFLGLLAGDPPRLRAGARRDQGDRYAGARSGIRSACSGRSPACSSCTARRCSSSGAYRGRTSPRSAIRRPPTGRSSPSSGSPGVTGFALELALYLPERARLGLLGLPMSINSLTV